MSPKIIKSNVQDKTCFYRFGHIATYMDGCNFNDLSSHLGFSCCNQLTTTYHIIALNVIHKQAYALNILIT